jgi:hypothetical protein
LNHLDLSLREDKKRKYQFRGIAETDVEQPTDGAAGPLCELLGGSAEPVGKDCDRGRRSDENPNGWGEVLNLLEKGLGCTVA